MNKDDLKSIYTKLHNAHNARLRINGKNGSSFPGFKEWKEKLKASKPFVGANNMAEQTEIMNKLKGISPGTLIVIQRELKTNGNFKNYLIELLKDPDPAKRIYIEMQKAQVNVLNPRKFRKDVGAKQWQWMRRRVKPLLMANPNLQKIAPNNAPPADGNEKFFAVERAETLGSFGDVWGDLFGAIVKQGSKELAKESTQESIMSFTEEKTGDRSEMRLRRAQVIEKAKEMGFPEPLKDKAELVATGEKTFEEAFGITPKVDASAEADYQNAQAGKLSAGAANELGVGANREQGIKDRNKKIMIYGGIGVLVLIAAITGILVIK